MNKTARKILAIGLVALVPLTYVCMPILAGIIAGCATTEEAAPPAPPPPVPDYSAGLYSFPRFELPNPKPPGSVKLSVVSVIPQYKDPKSQEAESGDKVSALMNEHGPLTKDMTKILRSFSNSVGEDLQGLLVAKGMTALGPTAIDEVTFPEKKASSLTVLMEFVFDIQYSKLEQRGTQVYAGNGDSGTDADSGATFGMKKVMRQENQRHGGAIHAATYSGTMTVDLKVYYYLLEPLSEEKMWVKKLDLGSEDYNFVIGRTLERYESGTRSEDDGCGGTNSFPVYAWRQTGDTLFDSRPKVFSDVLKTAYPKLMETAAKYFDTDEMTALRAKAQEIRERWGSSSFRRGETG